MELKWWENVHQGDSMDSCSESAEESFINFSEKPAFSL